MERCPDPPCLTFCVPGGTRSEARSARNHDSRTRNCPTVDSTDRAVKKTIAALTDLLCGLPSRWQELTGRSDLILRGSKVTVFDWHPEDQIRSRRPRSFMGVLISRRRSKSPFESLLVESLPVESLPDEPPSSLRARSTPLSTTSPSTRSVKWSQIPWSPNCCAVRSHRSTILLRAPLMTITHHR